MVLNFIYNKLNNDLKEIETKNLYGFLIFYLVFIIINPILITYFFGFQSLRFYLPIIDLFANLLSSSLSSFKVIYDNRTTNFFTYLSSIFISLLALTGVVWIGMYEYKLTKNMTNSILITIIMFLLTFLIPIDGIPFGISLIDKNKTHNDKIFDLKLIIGLFIIIFLFTIEGLIIEHVIK